MQKSYILADLVVDDPTLETQLRQINETLSVDLKRLIEELVEARHDRAMSVSRFEINDFVRMAERLSGRKFSFDCGVSLIDFYFYQLLTDTLLRLEGKINNVLNRRGVSELWVVNRVENDTLIIERRKNAWHTSTA